MAAPQAIPSFKERISSGQLVKPSQDMRRIRWKPFGPLADSVYVAEDPSDESSPQKSYQTGPASFHPISASPLTEPPVSSITVAQSDLEGWEEEWVEEHVPHADDEQAVWVDLTPGISTGAGEEDADAGGDDGEGRRLMRCCGTSRPVVPPALTVTPTASQPFVTVHDYITAVHYWLHTIRGSILEAKGVHEGQPLPENTQFHEIIIPDLTLVMLKQREPDASPSSWSVDPLTRVFQQIAAGQTPTPMSLEGFSEEYLRGLREDSLAIQRARMAWSVRAISKEI
ncbi:hypothetical protein KVR01_008574 [Diaporthe batatas]|uniref:uncharacterized protein n=1 Tax=Diaporthe batatas TaxID=748121 RepID=UPI001D03D823|nr:uncharacterized protein KVR01_008574 [Diaporthe batatas]KAG8161587.1 hypothetical protein KVR01_008574 [Diaporthe batatas]